MTERKSFSRRTWQMPIIYQRHNDKWWQNKLEPIIEYQLFFIVNFQTESHKYIV